MQSFFLGKNQHISCGKIETSKASSMFHKCEVLELEPSGDASMVGSGCICSLLRWLWWWSPMASIVLPSSPSFSVELLSVPPPFGWCCFPSSLLLGGTAWPPPSFGWCCLPFFRGCRLPSPPFGGAALLPPFLSPESSTTHLEEEEGNHFTLLYFTSREVD